MLNTADLCGHRRLMGSAIYINSNICRVIRDVHCHYGCSPLLKLCYCLQYYFVPYLNMQVSK